MNNVIEKICTRCKEIKPIANFWKDRTTKTGYMAYCIPCAKSHVNKWVINNQTHIKEANKVKYIKNKAKIDANAKAQREKIKADPELLKKHREYNRVRGIERRKTKDVRDKEKDCYIKNKLRIISHYSNGENCCECCKEKHIEFLTIDHINGGGRKHRKEVGNFFAWVKRNNYPPGFRILCMNCNFALGKFGYCPHNNHLNTLALKLPDAGSIAPIVEL